MGLSRLVNLFRSVSTGAPDIRIHDQGDFATSLVVQVKDGFFWKTVSPEFFYLHEVHRWAIDYQLTHGGRITNPLA